MRTSTAPGTRRSLSIKRAAISRFLTWSTTDNLDIKRGRQSEVDRLADDVRL